MKAALANDRECSSAPGPGQGSDGSPLLPRPASRRRAQNPGNLTDREIEEVAQLANGLSNKEIAMRLVISEKTVEHHLEHIYNKLDVTSRTAAVGFAVQNGIVT